MKPRARRITLAAAVLGAGVVGLAVILNWGIVRDHVEAWHFQLTRETETIEPGLIWENASARYMRAFVELSKKDGARFSCARPIGLFGLLVDCSRQPVVFERKADSLGNSCRFEGSPCVSTADALAALKANGWRVLEQRFPQRAYVIIRGEHASKPFHESGGTAGVYSQRSGCGGPDNGPLQEAAAAIYKEPWMRAISQPTPPEAPSRP